MTFKQAITNIGKTVKELYTENNYFIVQCKYRDFFFGPSSSSNANNHQDQQMYVYKFNAFSHDSNVYPN